MSIAYQYDASGYFVGLVDDYGLLPNNATYTAPDKREGHVPRWNGETWVQVENHIGEEGYLDGIAHTIKAYGPLPHGWSLEAPAPSAEEQAREARDYVLAQLAALDAEYLTPRILAGMAAGDEYALEQYRIHEEKAAPWRERLAAIPETDA